MFLILAVKSLLHRKVAVGLSVVALSVSVFALLGVEHARHQIKENFYNTVSEVDLIVGSRTGNINLLLYSVFRVGSPTRNIKYERYEEFLGDENIEWSVPISLGDSHRGFRVVGTVPAYFEKIKFSKERDLSFTSGQSFAEPFELVLGSEVSSALGYKIGDQITLSHGISKSSFLEHKKFPFSVTGILKATGTPIDRALYVGLSGLELIHMHPNQVTKSMNDLDQGVPIKIDEITAVMLGLKNRITTFKIQEKINRFQKEPLIAVIPGVALSELWQMVRLLENSLLLVTILVFVAACLGLSAMLLSSIRERHKEIQLLRIIGAPSIFLFLLIELESLLVTLISILIGMLFLSLSIFVLQDLLVGFFGMSITPNIFNKDTVRILAILIFAAFVTSIVPAFLAYRSSKDLVI